MIVSHATLSGKSGMCYTCAGDSYGNSESGRKDLPEILALQKLACQSEAELVDDYSIKPLTQTLDGIKDDFNNGAILKAVENGEIIGSVRLRSAENTVYVGKLIVAPERKNCGIGTALLLATETIYPYALLELFTSERSVKNLYLYSKIGYTEVKRKPLNDNANFVFLEKFATRFSMLLRYFRSFS